MSNQSLSINQQIDSKTEVKTSLKNDMIDMIDYKNEKGKIMKQIDGDTLIDDNKCTNSELEEIVSLIALSNLSAKPIRIGGINLDQQIVKEQFAKINHEHICYILDCLKNTKKKITNRKNYLLTCLYNAPSSMETQKHNSYDLDDFMKMAFWENPKTH